MQAIPISRQPLVALLGIGFTTLMLLMLLVGGAVAGEYYFIQIGTFSEPTNVERLVKKYKQLNEKVCARPVSRQAPRPMYQVLVGGFVSWKAADRHKLQLRRKGIFLEDSFILKLSNPDSCGSPEKNKTSPAGDETVVAGHRQGDIQREIKQKKPSGPVKPIKDLRDQGAPEEKSPALRIKVASNEKPPAVFAESDRGETGRNIKKGNWIIAFKHASCEYQSKLERRYLTTSGAAVSTSLIDVNSFSGQTFYTQIHRETVNVTYGFSDGFELSADVGIAHKDLSNISLTYGLGGRLNIFTFRNSRGNQYYGAISGEAHFGEIEYEFSGEDSARWYKKGDWQALSARFELGVVLTNISLYAGAAGTAYMEKADHRLLSNFPSGTTSYRYEDELGGDSYLSGFGGAAYYFNESVHIELEGQVGNPQGLSGTVYYKF